ncbi:response regulator [Candidatus Sumerlaeota bacterium]|nr:response regulator [Candidatus Sumerlaeota bacterium]
MTGRDQRNGDLSEGAVGTIEPRAAGRVLKEAERPTRVLVVDDDKEIRDLLSAAIRKSRLACDEAGDATEAMSRIGRETYDVVVLDLVLPDLNGLEMVSAIRRRSDATRIIVMTGYGDVESAAEALRAQADDYILKPFKIAEFMASLKQALERQEASRQERLTHQQLAQQVADLQWDLESRSTGGIMALAKALEARDPYTKGHCARVANMSLSVAGELDFNSSQLDEIGVGSLLHDVGKIAVPDNILLKAAPLTEEEYENIKRHPRLGYDILLPFFGQGIVTECALHHHERWDGKGYPEGLAGEQCPQVGRILAICDAFDAMTTARPYRPALSEAEALKEIEANRNKQFDPRIADLFCKIRLDLASRQ